MKIERFLSAFSNGLGLICLGLVLLFPLGAALGQLGDGGVEALLPLRAQVGVLDYLWASFHTDSGTMRDLAQSSLAMGVWLGFIIWLVIPRKWQRGDKVLLGLSLALGGWLWIAAGHAPNSHESRMVAAVYTSGLALFWWVASASREFLGPEAGEKGEGRIKWLLWVLPGIALAVALCAWITPAGGGYVGPEGFVALGGTFFQGNILAAFLVGFLPLVVSSLLYWGQLGAKREVWGAGGLLLGLGITLAMTFSLSGWLAWGLGIFLALLWWVQAAQLGFTLQRCSALLGGGAALVLALSGLGGGAVSSLAYLAALGLWWWVIREIKGSLWLWGTLALLILISGWSVSLFREEAQSQFALGQTARSEVEATDDNSLGARYEFARAALKMGLDNPWLGVGPNNFGRLYPRYQQDARWFSHYPHSLTLDIWVGAGLPALAFWSLALLWWGFNLWRQEPPGSLNIRELLRWSAAISALVLFLRAQTDLDISCLSLVFWGMAWAGMAWGLSGKSESERAPMGLNLALITVGALLLLFLSKGWEGRYYSYLGQELARSGRQAEAAQAFSWATEADPGVGEYWRQLAVNSLNSCQSLDQARRLSAALTFWSRLAIANDPQTASNYFTLGQALELAGDLAGAEEAFRKAIELDGQNSPVFYEYLARLYWHSGREDFARQTCDRALEVNLRNFLNSPEAYWAIRGQTMRQDLASILWLRYSLALEAGEEGAGRYLEYGLRLDPSWPQLMEGHLDDWCHQLELARRSGDLEAAREWRERSLNLARELARLEPQRKLWAQRSAELQAIKL